jgi:hypothetical protein
MNEIQSLKEEVNTLKTSLVGLEDKYDIDILVKNKAKRNKTNDKGLANQFIKVIEISASNLRKIKAMPKQEKKISKV